jgi:hypothetical protein
LTVAVTPSSLLSLRSIRLAQDAQVMPPIESSTAPPAACGLSSVTEDITFSFRRAG